MPERLREAGFMSKSRFDAAAVGFVARGVPKAPKVRVNDSPGLRPGIKAKNKITPCKGESIVD